MNYDFDSSKNLMKYGKDNFLKAYEKAQRQASIETELPLSTFPENPPFTFEQALDEDYLPE